MSELKFRFRWYRTEPALIKIPYGVWLSVLMPAESALTGRGKVVLDLDSGNAMYAVSFQALAPEGSPLVERKFAFLNERSYNVIDVARGEWLQYLATFNAESGAQWDLFELMRTQSLMTEELPLGAMIERPLTSSR